MRPTTSASNLFRRLLCPKSGQMEEGLPEEDSPLSREGVLLHDYDAHPEYKRQVLKPQQQELLARNEQLRNFALETCQDEITSDTYKTYKETKLTMLGTPYPIEGTPDFARYYLPGEAAVILDSKFGYSIVDRADVNIQLRAYAVMAYDFSPSKRIFVGILQPRLSFSEQVSLADYNAEDIEDARKQIIAILEASSKKDAPLVAGEAQCRYCKAKMICPAFQKAMVIPKPLTPADKALSKAARIAYLEQRLAEINDETLAKVIDAERFGKMIHDPLYAEARKRGETDYWKIAKETEVRDITDVRKALSLLSLSGLDKSDIFDCIEGVSLSKLAEKLNKLHPNWTSKEANEWINKKLSSVIEKQPRKARVLRK